MEKSFSIIRQTRQNFLDLIEGLSIEQLNRIPEGFNNNILWNLGHLVATQQVLCYKLGNAQPKVDLTFYGPKYGKGSKPETFIDAAELATIKAQIVEHIDSLQADVKSDLLNTYTPYTTSYGVALENISDAVKFVSVHEGMHYGCAIALKKLVS